MAPDSVWSVNECCCTCISTLNWLISAVAVQTSKYMQKWCPKIGYLTTCAPCTTIPTGRSCRVIYLYICMKRDRSNRIPSLVAFRCSPASVWAKSENWSYRLKTAVFRHMPILRCSVHVSECYKLKTDMQSLLKDCYLANIRIISKHLPFAKYGRPKIDPSENWSLTIYTCTYISKLSIQCLVYVV